MYVCIYICMLRHIYHIANMLYYNCFWFGIKLKVTSYEFLSLISVIDRCKIVCNLL